MEKWDRLGLPPISMAVNLSARQLRHQFLASLIEDSLGQHRIEPQRLELELTESLLMEDTEGTRSMLETFTRIGLRLAIDDFGTGHSSLAYLRRFRVDTLKIDRSFISETPHDSEACAVATAIVALGRSMQIKLVAEGVETDEQAAFLRNLGCHEIQGYLLTRPLPLPQLVEWYRAYEAQRRDPNAFGDEPDTIAGGLLLLADEGAPA
jgi:EAL domain-containing protein (putative c-di-GMP-specific phosphodiesterase class I)